MKAISQRPHTFVFRVDLRHVRPRTFRYYLVGHHVAICFISQMADVRLFHKDDGGSINKLKTFCCPILQVQQKKTLICLITVSCFIHFGEPHTSTPPPLEVALQRISRASFFLTLLESFCIRIAMKIQSLMQVILVLRPAEVVAKKNYVTRLGHNATTVGQPAAAATTAAAANKALKASSWFIQTLSFASIFTSAAPPPSSTTASGSRSRRYLSWVDRWAPDQGQTQAQAAFPVMGARADDSTSSTAPQNATNSSKPEVDPNLETITPWEFKNKTAFEKNNTISTNKTTTTSTKKSIHDDGGDNNNSPVLPLLLPPEKEQPTSWYMSVVIIFLALTLVLCTVTCCRVCRNKKRRRDYETVPY